MSEVNETEVEGAAPLSSWRGNALALIAGLALVSADVALRYSAPGKFDLKAIDIVLLSLPVLLWLLASGQFETFKIGASGFQVKSAIQRASAKPISLEVKRIVVQSISKAAKAKSDELEDVLQDRPRALTFILQKPAAKRLPSELYDASALHDYITKLMMQTTFKYFLFLGATPSQPFVGGIDACNFARSVDQNLYRLKEKADTDPTLPVSIQKLADILNGKAPFANIEAMPGYIGQEKAIKPTEDTVTALARMEELGIEWLPVVERNKYIGIVEKSTLSASLVLDVTRALGKHMETRRS